MRLLNVKTKELEEFYESDIPAYAVLSPTWGKNELTFDGLRQFHINRAANLGNFPKGIPGIDAASGASRQQQFTKLENQHSRSYRSLESEGVVKLGSSKVDDCCEVAITYGCKYIWIDTCNIDKSSSAELSEAINSMFAWYKNAKVCFVYLADVRDADISSAEIDSSRWFTRGWTLQELLAPEMIAFYNCDWTPIAHLQRGLHEIVSKQEEEDEMRWAERLSGITGIPNCYIRGMEISEAGVAMKMSWASKRITTRKEDEAYCLLGIFDVNMSLLYGEGGRAFMRLQEEIIRTSDDHSLFAWTEAAPRLRNGDGSGISRSRIGSRHSSILAGSPSCFASSQGTLPRRNTCAFVASHYSITNLGIQMVAKCLPFGDAKLGGVLMPLDCSPEDRRRIFAIPLLLDNRDERSQSIYYRSRYREPIQADPDLFTECKPRSIYIAADPKDQDMDFLSLSIKMSSTFKQCLHPISLKAIWPPHIFSAYNSMIDQRWHDVSRWDLLLSSTSWLDSGSRYPTEVVMEITATPQRATFLMKVSGYVSKSEPSPHTMDMAMDEISVCFSDRATSDDTPVECMMESAAERKIHRRWEKTLDLKTLMPPTGDGTRILTATEERGSILWGDSRYRFVCLDIDGVT